MTGEISAQIRRTSRGLVLIIVLGAIAFGVSQWISYRKQNEQIRLSKLVLQELQVAGSERAIYLSTVLSIRNDLDSLMAEGRARSLKNRADAIATRRDMHRLAASIRSDLSDIAVVLDSTRLVLPKPKKGAKP